MTKYKIDINEITIEFRLLTSKESDRFMSAILNENVLAEEYIFNLITDHKYDIDKLSAGTIVTVLYLAFKLSGAVLKKQDFPALIEKARINVKSDILNTLYANIIKYMPSYNIEILREKSLNEVLELLAFAEMICGQDIIDIDKVKQAFSDEPAKTTAKKKGALAITKSELEALKATLQSEEIDGKPISGY